MTKQVTGEGLYDDSVVATIISGLVLPPGFVFSANLGSYAASIAPDATVANIWGAGVLTGNLTWANPTNARLGQLLMLVATQDGSGAHTISYGANYRTGGATAVSTTLSTVNMDIFLCTSAAGTVWRILARITGQAI